MFKILKLKMDLLISCLFNSQPVSQVHVYFFDDLDRCTIKNSIKKKKKAISVIIRVMFILMLADDFTLFFRASVLDLFECH